MKQKKEKHENQLEAESRQQNSTDEEADETQCSIRTLVEVIVAAEAEYERLNKNDSNFKIAA